MAVVDQGLDLAGIDTDTGEPVVAVEFEVNGFTCGQGHGAHLGNDGTVVAHLRREQRDVATQCSFDFAFVDDAAGAAIALIAVFTGHEVGIADAVGGGHDAAHIDARVFAKVNARRVGQHHLAIGCDAAKDLAGVAAHHAVERHAVGARLLELHLSVFADVETLPVDGGAVSALLDHHVGAAAADLRLTGADLPTGGQRIGCGLGRGHRPRGQQSGRDQTPRSIKLTEGLQQRDRAGFGHGRRLQARLWNQADVIVLPKRPGVFCGHCGGVSACPVGTAGARAFLALTANGFTDSDPGQTDLAPDDFEKTV